MLAPSRKANSILDKRSVVDKYSVLNSNEAPRDRVTRRSGTFTMANAKDATDQYTDLLWEGVQKRLPYTDLSNSPCAFSEAPAEGIFSIFSRVCRGRESLTIAHATALTRIAAHGPPAATKDAAEIAKKALENYKSQFGERFCTTFWRPGST